MNRKNGCIQNSSSSPRSTKTTKRTLFISKCFSLGDFACGPIFYSFS